MQFNNKRRNMKLILKSSPLSVRGVNNPPSSFQESKCDFLRIIPRIKMCLQVIVLTLTAVNVRKKSPFDMNFFLKHHEFSRRLRFRVDPGNICFREDFRFFFIFSLNFKRPYLRNYWSSERENGAAGSYRPPLPRLRFGAF